MNWCVRRYMKAHSWLIPWDSNLHRIQAARSLYSQAKIWVFLKIKIYIVVVTNPHCIKQYR